MAKSYRVTVELPRPVWEALRMMARADGMWPFRLDLYLSYFICRSVDSESWHPDGDRRKRGQPERAYENAYGEVFSLEPVAFGFPSVEDDEPRCGLGLRPWWLRPGAARRMRDSDDN